MPVVQNQQITLEMVLRAQDQASAAIKAVGSELAKVGKGIDVGTFSGSVRSSLSAVNAQLKQAADERLRMARESAAQELSAARADRATKLRDIRDDYEQQRAALGKATLAQRQALRAAREAEQDIVKEAYDKQVEITKSGLARETSAISAALQEQLRLQRTNAEDMISASRKIATEQTRASAGAGAGEGGGGTLERFANFGKQLIIWNLGYAAVGKVTQAFGAMAGGLVSVNANLEQYQATFNSIYQSSTKGQEAVAWLTNFAVQVPATREQTIQAGLAVASLGDDVTKVLQPLSNVAAVMGVDLPRAAQAFADAQEGRFQMLQTTLHITKQELVEYGLQLNSSGQVLNNSFVPAFEKLGNVRFGQAATLQMHTFGGLVSNVADAFTKLQEIMGKPIFDVIKGKLQGLIDLMGRTDVQRWALGIGDAIAHMLQGAINAAQWMAVHFGPPIGAAIGFIAFAWQKAAPIIADAVRLIEGVMAGIGMVLQHDVLPVVQNAIGQIVQWWQGHGQDITTVLNEVAKVAKTFWDWLGRTAHDAMTVLQGYWTIAWGVLSGVVGVAIDLISGDWKRAKTDLLGIWNAIEVGVLEIVNGLVDNVIHIFGLLAGPIRNVLNAIFPPAFKAVVDVGVEMFTYLVLKIEQAMQRMVGNVGASIVAFAQKWGPLIEHLPGGHAAAAALYAAAAVSLPGSISNKAIAQRAKATGQDAAGVVGGLLGPAPIPSIPFDATKATTTVDAFFAGIEKKVDVHLTSGASDVGKKWWNTFTAELKKQHLTPPLLPGGGVPPGATGIDLSLPGFSTTTAGQQKKALDQATRDAQDRFQLLLDSGKATWSAGIKDINAILSAEQKAGASPVQMQLDALRDTKDLVNNLLDTARKHFDFDTNVAHPSRAQMQKDEASVLAILAKTPGIQPIDLSLAKQQMDKTIADTLKKTTAGTGGPVSVPTPLYGPYRIVAPQYGATQVSFGGVQQSSLAAMVQHLQALLSYWQARARRDEQGLRVQEEVADHTKQIATNTARLGAQPSGHTMGHEPVYPSPAGATVRARGGFAPMHKN